MQLFEFIFLILLFLTIVRLISGPIHPHFRYAFFVSAGIGVAILGMIFEGWRWQMIPAYLAFGLLVVSLLKKSESSRAWRIAGAFPLIILLSTSVFLSMQLPVFRMPVPNGPYAVGNMDHSLVDTSRIERWVPDRKRELYLEIWYPAASDNIDAYPVRTLHQELYSGDYDLWSFLLGYLKNIPTYSRVRAPLAANEFDEFPVLLFNHGGDGFTSQNQILMEHLASNGYIIVSIGHPYQSLKVNLPIAGTVTLTSERPKDIDFDVESLERRLRSKIRDSGNLNAEEESAIRGLLLGLANEYKDANTDHGKNQIVSKALELSALQPYLHLMSEKTLAENLLYLHGYQNRQLEYWVEDTKFVADSLNEISTGIVGLDEALGAEDFGVFGMSYGGAVAGEFCKIDSRCSAGSNLDGTQFGSHSELRVQAPFLMFYNEEHQGGNDFAYLPATHEYREYTIRGASHFDFMDVAYGAPILKTLGLGGEIEGERIIQIVNTIQLDFFDQYLKGKEFSEEKYNDIPEIVYR